MRTLVAVAGLLGGCFDPSDGPGFPDAALGPSGDDGGSTITDSPIVQPDAPVDATTQTHFEYAADVAECIDPTSPGAPAGSRTFCRNANDDNAIKRQMVVDVNDTGEANPWHAYIRIPVDSAFAGKTITSVVLRATTTDDDLAPGNTGQVFAVQPFTAAGLDAGAPATIGTRLSPTQGTVQKLVNVNFPLPLDSVTAGTTAHFGILPTGGSGVNYWNIDGPNPPRLIIDTE